LDIDITDPSAAPFLADLFDIWPRGGVTPAGDLTEDGLPRDRLFEVEELLARLCGEELDSVKRVYLNRAIQRTYIDLTQQDVPTMDDFLQRILNPTRADREPAYWLGERLSIYRSDQTLGLYFNQRGNAFDFSEAQLINFDFGSSKGNPKLVLIGTMAAKMVIERTLFTPASRVAGSFLQVDEFGALAQSAVLARTVDDLVRTTRKYHMQITLASQRPEDFMEQEHIRAIASDLPVRYLFNMPADTAAKAFDLTPGQARLVASLSSGGSDYRDCALISPSVTARIRLRYGPVEGRLFMEAATGKEKFSAAEALGELPTDAPASLVAALKMEPRAMCAQPAAA
jgi:type IV secretory pathway VirB4 component